ncbi:hypothetical protein HK100_006285 [Physocladia obscura]|uniref:Uncharacterized protein n=1 Tax=Physocladia obscura TaxID=109957 RepID=A0AAD5SWA3_9FUNG|nr:hypothetical protein HK100_006285 [Physocladia obscura]
MVSDEVVLSETSGDEEVRSDAPITPVAMSMSPTLESVDSSVTRGIDRELLLSNAAYKLDGDSDPASHSNNDTEDSDLNLRFPRIVFHLDEEDLSGTTAVAVPTGLQHLQRPLSVKKPHSIVISKTSKKDLSVERIVVEPNDKNNGTMKISSQNEPLPLRSAHKSPLSSKIKNSHSNKNSKNNDNGSSSSNITNTSPNNALKRTRDFSDNSQGRNYVAADSDFSKTSTPRRNNVKNTGGSDNKGGGNVGAVKRNLTSKTSTDFGDSGNGGSGDWTVGSRRRSSRVKVTPCKFWKNERAEYEFVRDENGGVLVPQLSRTTKQLQYQQQSESEETLTKISKSLRSSGRGGGNGNSTRKIASPAAPSKVSENGRGYQKNYDNSNDDDNDDERRDDNDIEGDDENEDDKRDDRKIYATAEIKEKLNGHKISNEIFDTSQKSDAVQQNGETLEIFAKPTPEVTDNVVINGLPVKHGHGPLSLNVYDISTGRNTNMGLHSFSHSLLLFRKLTG